MYRNFSCIKVWNCIIDNVDTKVPYPLFNKKNNEINDCIDLISIVNMWLCTIVDNYIIIIPDQMLIRCF